MPDPAFDAADAIREDEPETYLSWSDDGIYLCCERQECKRLPLDYWYACDLPYKLTPEMALAARDAHIATHGSANA